MEENQIREIYIAFKGVIPFDEKENFSEQLNKYIKNEKTHLYIDDNRCCEYLTDNEMKERYNSGKGFYSIMFKTDEEFRKYQNNNYLDIKDCIDYKTFCIGNEINALVYFGKDINEIIKIINSKY